MGLVQRALRRKMNAIDDRRWATVANEMQPAESRELNTPCQYVFNDGPPEQGILLMSDAALYMLATSDGAVARVVYGDLHEVVVLEPHLIGIRFTNRHGEDASQVISLFASPISALLRDRLVDRAGGIR